MTPAESEEREVDMSRPVPAAPTPGAAWRRAKLTDRDRKRISADMAKRRRRSPPPEEIAWRRVIGDVDKAQLKDGTYWIFRAGLFEAECVVQAAPGTSIAGRIGWVQGLLSTWGDGITVVVRWERKPGDAAGCRPGPFWGMDELIWLEGPTRGMDT